MISSPGQPGLGPASMPHSRAEVLPEMLQRALHREGSHAAQTAQRPLQHRLQQLLPRVADTTPFGLALPPLEDAIAPLAPARRADAARRALAAGLLRAEFHRVTGHPGHVDRVVEYDDAAVTEQRADGRQRFVV